MNTLASANTAYLWVFVIWVIWVFDWDLCQWFDIMFCLQLCLIIELRSGIVDCVGSVPTNFRFLRLPQVWHLSLSPASSLFGPLFFSVCCTLCFFIFRHSALNCPNFLQQKQYFFFISSLLSAVFLIRLDGGLLGQVILLLLHLVR